MVGPLVGLKGRWAGPGLLNPYLYLYLYLTLYLCGRMGIAVTLEMHCLGWCAGKAT